jgi:hypothetical protein
LESGTLAAGSAADRPDAGRDHAREGDKGLKAGALGYLSNLVIGVASTAPGYSLAATLGDNPLKGAIIGSTPHKLVQLSETPVLVVRA